MALTLDIDLTAQRLRVCEGGRTLREYAVSTGANGNGEIQGSGCTPRGRHIVRAKIGGGLPAGAVLRARRWTREVWSPELGGRYSGRDWILSRILWLSGLEPGRNRLGCVDTFRRYIYLHGTPDTDRLGTPASHGCVRMRNEDVIELFDLVPAGTEVDLHE
ncbi:MAG: L,D-transpeptidase [Solimonas sp.]